MIDYFQVIRMFLDYFNGFFLPGYQFVLYFLFANCIIWVFFSHHQNYRIVIKYI